MKSSNPIQQISKQFRIFFTVGIYLVPLFTLGFWLTGGYPNMPVVDAFLPSEFVPLVQLMPVWGRIAACLLSFIPAGVVMAVLFFLIRLFKLYENNKIFTADNVRLFRSIGYTILIGEILGLFFHPAITLLVSATSGMNHAIAEIKFDIGDITTFLVAFLIILISWIMRAGQRLQEESDYTV